MDHPLGIDFGGTGIKGAPVDLALGEFAAKRVKIDTPKPSTPPVVAGVFAKIASSYEASDAPIGVTFPGVVRDGVVLTAANIDKSWIGVNADHVFTEALGRELHVINDADAAGLAEVEYGAAKGRHGVVLVTTLGTGIGSALIHDGVLVPNLELGRLEIDGIWGERFAANSIRVSEGLGYPEWAERLTRYYAAVEAMFSPNLIVVGGGVSKGWEHFGHLIDIKTEIVPAKLRNKAGIIGAVLAATRAAR